MKVRLFLLTQLLILLISIPAASCIFPKSTIVYVDTDGSGDFNCDGTNDDVEINQALAFVANSDEYTTVHLNGPNTYIISSPLTIGSGITLTGDSSACVKLVDNAGWSKDNALIMQDGAEANHITIHGFEMDGNHDNQGVDMGYYYYNLITFTDPYNIDIHNMYLHDNSNDAIHIEASYNDIASNIYDNKIIRSGHEGVYLINTKNVSVFNNIIGVRCNGAIRTYNSDEFSFYNNIIYKESGGFAGFQIQMASIPSSGGEIYNNIIKNTMGPGVLLVGSGTYNANDVQCVHIYHNIIYGTGLKYINAGISIHGWNDVLVENNVIDSCYGDGIVLDDALGYNPDITGTCYVTVRNNIIINTKKISSTKGNGISDTASGHEFVLKYNIVWNNEGNNYHGV